MRFDLKVVLTAMKAHSLSFLERAEGMYRSGMPASPYSVVKGEYSISLNVNGLHY